MDNGDALQNLSNAYDALRHTVKLMIWTSAIFAILISLLAISGISLAWYALHKDVQQQEELIVQLCREHNELKKSMIITFIELGIPRDQLRELDPVVCTPKELQRDYHR